MTKLLSHSARVLLVRLFFVILAVSALYGIYDNREFLLRSPFYFLAIFEFVFAVLLFYFAALYPTLEKTRQRFAEYILLAYWLYVVIFNATGSALFALNLGLQNAASATPYSVAGFIAAEVVNLILLPSIAFAIVWLFVRSLR